MKVQVGECKILDILCNIILRKPISQWSNSWEYNNDYPVNILFMWYNILIGNLTNKRLSNPRDILSRLLGHKDVSYCILDGLGL